MSTIGPIGSSLGTAHVQVLKRAEQALQTEKPTAAFTDRITNALDQVADAQSKSAELAKSYEMGVELSLIHISEPTRPY